jgi:hypothetical protein
MIEILRFSDGLRRGARGRENGGGREQNPGFAEAVIFAPEEAEECNLRLPLFLRLGSVI